MSARTVQVSAQWALDGKTDNKGYRVIACSTGDLTLGNFADALSRFQLGALNTLPQVSVSYARLGGQPGTSYLALAIHWFAADDQRYADGVLQLDDLGRDTAFTSYFCLPYRKLAEHAIGYEPMFAALAELRLPVVDAPPVDVTLAAPELRVPAEDNLALRVAPLLLTGAPVCVLGAEDTTMAERLRFIDSVMALLPYGFRTRMTAATWTRATNREHRFRLFFSSVPRAGQSDHVVTWGQPDLVRLPGGAAGDYFDWLVDKTGPLSRLHELTTELALGPKAAIQALELVEGNPHRPPYRPPARELPAAPPPADYGEEMLLECVQYAETPNPTRLRSAINGLRRYAESGGIDEGRRRRYRELIARHGLLRRNYVIEKYEDRLYDALLPLAFGQPLAYDGYCQLEHCLGLKPGDSPQAELIRAIERGGMADPVAAGIVYWQLRTAEEKKLNKWLASGQLNAVDMIYQLARPWPFPAHARIVCDITLDYLKKLPTHYDPLRVREALRLNGFLAVALHRQHPENDHYQYSALYQFLRAAYPSGIDRASIIQILTGTPRPPTPALLAALLALLPRPGDWRLAHEMYAYGAITLMNVDVATRERLRDRAPAKDTEATRAWGFPPPGG